MQKLQAIKNWSRGRPGNEANVSALQCDVDLISAWISSINNYLTANVENSKCMLIACKQFKYASYLNGKSLECIKHFKYLRHWISDNLSWSSHIEVVCSKPRRMLVSLMILSPHYDADTILTLYRAHVLRILDYVSIVWGPGLKNDQQDLHPRLALEAFHIWKQPLPLNRDRGSLPPAYNQLLKNS